MRAVNNTCTPKQIELKKGTGKAWAYRNSKSWDVYYKAKDSELVNFELPVEVKR